jgi:hypothetical protein
MAVVKGSLESLVVNEKEIACEHVVCRSAVMVVSGLAAG